MMGEDYMSAVVPRNQGTKVEGEDEIGKKVGKNFWLYLNYYGRRNFGIIDNFSVGPPTFLLG